MPPTRDVSRKAWCEHGPVSVLIEPGAVTVVTIDRPDVHNAVDTATADALESAVREFDRDEDARVLVLTGIGDVAFCAGDGIDAEARRGEAALNLPEMIAGLERFRAGERPAPPE